MIPRPRGLSGSVRLTTLGRRSILVTAGELLKRVLAAVGQIWWFRTVAQYIGTRGEIPQLSSGL